ncbi:MAG: hypothetical protein F2786_00525 [Actinobacteria bacterium]|uniref:Unannotated protein n=1 Tax=freshwater metagenome TaxID=449393 RepID=A0A6J7CFZ5_9ZZZZ|nr:hypothetical protein [Actinomycetota bacterium]
MAEKRKFLNWVGFKSDDENQPSSFERIRELESQLVELRSRRDINGLSKQEFEILATETAMAMIRSAQARESKANSTASRMVAETNRITKGEIEAADAKVRSILSAAEARSRKYLQTAEEEAGALLAQAESEAEAVIETKRREIASLAIAARREGEKIIANATSEVANYRSWLSGVVSEAERLYKVQTQSLDTAQNAIHLSRERLESAFIKLAELQKNVLENLNSDDTIINSGPIRIASERTKVAISAPKKTTKKNVSNAKKSTKAIKKPVKKVASKKSAARK